MRDSVDSRTNTLISLSNYGEFSDLRLNVKDHSVIYNVL